LPSVPTSRAHARDFRREHGKLLDHRVDDGRRAQEFAFERTAFDVETHGLQEVALGYRGHGGGEVRRRAHEVVDHRIERHLHLAPGAGVAVEAHALPRLALAADHLADARQLLRHLVIGRDDLVEAVGDLAFDAGPVGGQAGGEVAVGHGGERGKELAAIEHLAALCGLAVGAIDARRAFPGGLGGRDFHCGSATKLGRSAERKIRRAAAIIF